MNSDKKQEPSIELQNIDHSAFELIKEMEEKYPEMTEKFKELCAQQYITFLKKQYDYGPTNIAMNTALESEQDLKLAMTGLITRMNDKMSRLINLILKKEAPKNESVEDSFTDISVYGKIALIVLKG